MELIKYNFDIADGIVRAESMPQPWSYESFIYKINDKGNERIFYSWVAHQNIIALLKEHHTFDSFLDIGSGDGQITQIFKFLGKETISIEPYDMSPKSQEFAVLEPDYKKDYLDITFNRQFDVIWCSHVFEHLRNPGIFLDKVFVDLKEEGILALTVPYNEYNNIEHLVDGHINKLGIGIMIYHLISSGFDCKEIAINFYSYEMSIFLRKKSNHVDKSNTANSFTALSKFFPQINQSITFDHDRLSAMTFTKNSVNWRW